MEIRWHPYRYYPYERELAFREIRTLLSPDRLTETRHGIRLEGTIETKAIERLVYFNELFNGRQSWQTLQGRLERVNGNGPNRHRRATLRMGCTSIKASLIRRSHEQFSTS